MYGYGNEDLFSSLRTEASFNDSPYNSTRDSISMPAFLQGQSSHVPEKNMGDPMNQKRPGLMETVGARNKVNGAKDQLVFNISKIREENKHMAIAQNDFMPAVNYDEVIFGNAFEKDFAMDIGLPEGKLPFVNKRSRSSSLSGKDYQESNYNPKISNAALKGKPAKHRYSEGVQNYIPSRSETRRNREQLTDKFSLNSNPFPTNNLLACTEKKEVEVIDLENIDECDNFTEENKTYPVSTTSSEEQTRSMETEFNCASEEMCCPKRNLYESSLEEISVCIPTVPNYSNKQQQIQAIIVEKLIKDTVSFEFDAVRQLLYLQQLLLLRHLHKNLEVFENHNASNSEFMLKVIEELMQENRLLRKAVIAHQRRT